MEEQGQSEDVSQLLEEETAEEEQFRLAHQNSTHLKPGAAIGLVHSPTTDTLDSVYLDAPLSEAEFTESGEISLDEKGDINLDEKEGTNVIVEQEETDADFNASEMLEKSVKTEEDLDGISIDIDKIDLDDVEVGPGIEIKGDSQPSLTKYFGSATNDDPLEDDFFSSLPPVDTGTLEDTGSNTVDRDETKNDADQDNIDSLLDMIIDDSQMRDKSDVDNKDDTTVSRLSTHEPQPDAESVLFEMSEDIEEKAPPVEIEDEKEDFESFTADLADTETMDALGMSPAATSFMTERNIQDYFRQSSQAESVRSLGLERQVSSSSGAPSQDQSHFSSSLDDNHSIPSVPATEKHSQPPTPSHRLSSTSEEKLGAVTETQQNPVIPSSATLSPVESPVHQPALAAGKDTQTLESGKRDTVLKLSYLPYILNNFSPYHTSSTI